MCPLVMGLKLPQASRITWVFVVSVMMGVGPSHWSRGCLFLCLDMSADGERKARLPRWMLWTPRSRSRRKPRHSPPPFNACNSGEIRSCFCIALLSGPTSSLASFASLVLMPDPIVSILPIPLYCITPS